MTNLKLLHVLQRLHLLDCKAATAEALILLTMSLERESTAVVQERQERGVGVLGRTAFIKTEEYDSSF